MKEIQNLPFFFIIGRPRSGTTLLRTLLDAHSFVKVPPEYPVILKLYNRFGKLKSWSAEDVEAFDAAFRQKLPSEYWKLEYLNIDEIRLKQLLGKLPTDAKFTDFIKVHYSCYQSVYPTTELKILGDKNPVFATYVKRLMKIFPEARFIFLTRDYRDNFVSVRRFSFEAPIVALQAYRWKYVTRMMLGLKKQFPNRILHIRHEDVIASAPETLSTVCDFLGIEMDMGMLDFYKKKDEVYNMISSAHFDKFHSGLGQPINPSRMGLWEEKLTDNEVKTADAVVGIWAERAGYKRKYTYCSASIILKTIPWQLYGYFLYQLMSFAEFLPPGLRKHFARFLPMLARIWHRYFKKDK
ncbi:MAG: sulfotransferase [Bacteroidales bacterium]|nr:sulfotransferase [Bacteroidales bacterium]